MAIKDIVTIVDIIGERAAASLAAELAHRLDAHLAGLSVAFDPLITPAGIGPMSESLMISAREAAISTAKVADAAFQDIARRAGARFENLIAEIPPDGNFADILRRSRLSDLVVIGQENPDHPEPMRGAMIEALLFDGGAPTLLIPYIGAKALSLDRALIAWDGGATAARAVRAALPLLAMNSSVTVLMVGRRAEEGSGLAAYLDRHGLRVEVKQVPSSEVPVADVVLNAAMDDSFDWVVMGAYGHSRFREYLFGGATRDILREMTVPVLMTH